MLISFLSTLIFAFVVLMGIWTCELEMYEGYEKEDEEKDFRLYRSYVKYSKKEWWE